MKNWKTTLQGLLSFVVCVGAVALTQPAVIPTKISAPITLAVGIAKAVLGLIQSDAKPSVTSSVTIEQVTPEPKA